MSQAGNGAATGRVAPGTSPHPAPPRRLWYVVEAPYFCCLVLVEDGAVTRTAPILDWILARRDRSLTWLTRYAAKRRWTLEQLAT
jgi:hypothetical protein